MTVADWFGLSEDQPGELVDGRIVEGEVPSVEHEIIILWLAGVLRAWLRGMGMGVVIGSGAKYELRPDRGRMPDLSVFLGERKPPARGAVPIPPDIAVEVVSERPEDKRRDRIEKMSEYAGFGVRFYWVIDPEIRGIEIYELEGTGFYRRALGATNGKLDLVPGCNGLLLDLDDLWREVDALGR